MKIVLQTIALACSILPLIASAEGTHSDFVRQIDRPVQDAQGVRRLSFGIAGEKRLHYDTLSVKLSPGFSYAVTDGITLSDLPWPVLQVRLKTPKTGTTISNGLDALALSFRAGVTSTSVITQISTRNDIGYYDDYIRILAGLGLLAKMPISNFLWAQGEIMTEMVIEEAIQGFIYPRIGCQFSKYIYMTIGYRGGFFRFFEDFSPRSRISYLYRYAWALDYYHSSNADKPNNGKVSYSSAMPVALGIDLGRHFSMIVATSIGKKVGIFVPVDCQFQISW